MSDPAAQPAVPAVLTGAAESAAQAAPAPASGGRRRRGGDSPLLELPDEPGSDEAEESFDEADDDDDDDDDGDNSSSDSGSGSDDDGDKDAAALPPAAAVAAPVVKTEGGSGAARPLKRRRELGGDDDDEDDDAASAPAAAAGGVTVKSEDNSEAPIGPTDKKARSDKADKKDKKDKKEKNDKKEKKEKKDKKDRDSASKSSSSSGSKSKSKLDSRSKRDARRYLDSAAADVDDEEDDEGRGRGRRRAYEDSEDELDEDAEGELRDFITDEGDALGGYDARKRGSVLASAAAAMRAEEERLAARTHAQIEADMEASEAAKIRAQTEARYGTDAEELYRQELEQEEAIEARRGAGSAQAEMPLPSVRDTVFIVRCNPGKEPLAVWELYQRFQEMQEEAGDEAPMLIQSAYYVPAAKGYVYVEALKRAHVERAVRDSEHLRGWSVKLVPPAELAETLTVGPDAPTTTGVTTQVLRAGSFVRVRTGLYKDDLALVVRTFEQGTACVLKIVPRLDLTASGVKGRAGAASARVRPAQGLFDGGRVRMAGGDVARGRGAQAMNFASFDQYKSGLYLDGFLYKQYGQLGVVADLSRQPPTQAELDRFYSGPVASALAKGLVDADRDDDDDGGSRVYTDAASYNKRYLRQEAGILAQAMNAVASSAGAGPLAISHTAASAAAAGYGASALVPAMASASVAAGVAPGMSRSAFAPGDGVSVVGGDLTGLEGVVLAVSDDGQQLTVKAQNIDLAEPLTVPAKDAVKRFEVGDRVLIRSGTFAGFSALVTFVDTDAFQLSVVTDVSKESTDVAFEDAVHTVAVQGGAVARDVSFVAGDIVQMPTYVGYVCAVEAFQCRVMDADGVVHAVPLTAMGQKRFVRFASALDARSTPVHRGDIVVPASGPAAGKRCVVQHIVGSRLFLHNRDVAANGGVFTAPAGAVSSVKEIPATGMRTGGLGAAVGSVAAASPWIGGGEAGSAAAAASAAPYNPRTDPLAGRNVIITKGSYKGLMARVVDCLPTAYILVLTARKAKIQLPRDSVMDAKKAAPATATASHRGLAAGQTPMLGGATPFLGGATPHLGGKTPAYDGKTPAYAATPGYAAEDAHAYRGDDDDE